MERMETPKPSEVSGLIIRIVQGILSGGYAPLTLTTACLTITMILARAWWVWDAKQDDDYRKYVAELIHKETDPFKASDHQILLAALLESSVVTKVDCEKVTTSPVCSEVDELFDRLTALTAKFSSKEMKPRLKSTSDVIHVNACMVEESATAPLWERFDPVYGPAGCEERHLFIPQQLNTRETPWHESCRSHIVNGMHVMLGQGLSYSEETLASVTFSAYLDEAASKLLEKEKKSDAEPDVVQIYYISREGVLRIWRRFPPTPEELYPAFVHKNLSYRHTGQFLETEEGRHNNESVISPPYLDVTDAGVVQTICHPHRGEREPHSLLGALCVDLAPVIELDTPLSPVLEICMVRTGNSGRVLSISSNCPLSPEEIVLLLREYQQSMGRRVEGQDTQVAVALMRKLPEEKMYAIVQVKSRAGHFLRTVSLLLMLGVSTSLCVALAIQSIRQRALESEDGMLRNLQVGVIQVADNDLIMEANDRAEELVGYALPPFGGGEDPCRITDLFHEQTFKEDEKGELVLSSLQDINHDRLRGHSSRYYVKKREPDLGLPRCTWLHVYGSPWLLSDQVGARTFAVLSPASTSRVENLERAARDNRVQFT